MTSRFVFVSLVYEVIVTDILIRYKETGSTLLVSLLTD
jgi:hypothetical protein